MPCFVSISLFCKPRFTLQIYDRPHGMHILPWRTTSNSSFNIHSVNNINNVKSRLLDPSLIEVELAPVTDEVSV